MQTFLRCRFLPCTAFILSWAENPWKAGPFAGLAGHTAQAVSFRGDSIGYGNSFILTRPDIENRIDGKSLPNTEVCLFPSTAFYQGMGLFSSVYHVLGNL